MKTATTEQEMRCPADHRRLFGIMCNESIHPEEGEEPLVQFACRECRKMFQVNDQDVVRVLHYFNLEGQFVRTEVIRRG